MTNLIVKAYISLANAVCDSFFEQAEISARHFGQKHWNKVNEDQEFKSCKQLVLSGEADMWFIVAERQQDIPSVKKLYETPLEKIAEIIRENDSPKPKNNSLHRKNYAKAPRMVKRISPDGAVQYYRSIYKAAEANGVCSGTLRNILEGYPITKRIRGWKYPWIKDYKWEYV